MFICGLGTAAPPQRYTQKECWDVFELSLLSRQLTPRSRAIVRKILTGNNGISTRHLALDNIAQAFELTPDVMHSRFTTHAPALATQAARSAMADSGTSPAEIDALIISTCTGYTCPGLTSYVSQQLGLRSDALSLDLVGQGCVAAMPNLRTGEALLASGRCKRVLSVCVEVCSAALYFDNDPGVLVSACLFGDGAAAALLSSQPNGKRHVEWKMSGSILAAEDRELLRFEQKQGMLRNILMPQVPARASEHAASLLSNVLEKAQVEREQITGWVLHPGGRDVLVALQKELRLNETDVRWSASVLREFGNLSSPSVLFVLQMALADSAPSGFWWMSSFGAGFSCQGALLKVG
jgi:alkylresorcinol/alkylpyrone synthase